MNSAVAFLIRAMKDPVGAAALIALLVFAVGAVLGPSLFRTGPYEISYNILAPPSGSSILGTDDLGRNVLVELVYGLRVSLLVGVSAALIATVLGIAVGATAGYFGSWLDTIAMRVAEAFQIVPAFILAALVVALVGPGLTRVVFVLAILTWPGPARVMRSEVLRVKNLEFVDAARCLGFNEWAVMLREVIPNSLGPVAAIGTLIIGQAILLESALSFFGLTSPDVVSWGRMMNTGQKYLFEAWWLSVFPGLAIFAVVLTFNVFGDLVTRLLNPRYDS